ncbi:MAG: redoxin domain-containing protein [Anaerolineae bacterium]|nr:redoxin domain-containing protein [Anaerolineae bacterium]
MTWIEFGPAGRQHGAPDFRLVSTTGETVSRVQFRQRTHLVLLFLPASLPPSAGEALQRLAAARDDLAEASAALYALGDSSLAGRVALPLLVDADGAVRQAYAALFPPDQRPTNAEPFAVILDRYGAPAFIRRGLPDASAISEEFLTRVWGLEYECPE